jgi:NhaP-type Na+/H+ or K+/H+ antiporter
VLIGLTLGLLAGPAGLKLIEPQLAEDSALIQSLTEAVLLVSLFCVGLRLRAPFESGTWRPALQLSSVTLIATLLLGAAAAHLLLHMSVLQCLLLAAILAPTDAALAAELHPAGESESDSMLNTLTTEGAITSALAIPLVVLFLTLMGVSERGADVFGSISLTVLWVLCGGATVGWLLGMAVSRCLALIDRDRDGDLLEEMIVFATAVLAYTCAVALRSDELLAVLAAGLALSHSGRLRPRTRTPPLGARVLRLAGRAERTVTLLAAALVGALLGSVGLSARIALYAAVLVIVVRPLSVRLGLARSKASGRERRAIELFAARGAAPMCCLAIAIEHGLPDAFAEQLAAVVLAVIVGSILSSAVSASAWRRPTPGAVGL